MATLTKEQIEAKKQQVEQLNDEELGQATGGSRNPVNDDEDIIIDTTPYVGKKS